MSESASVSFSGSGPTGEGVPPEIRSYRGLALVAGIVGLVLLLIGALIPSERVYFFRAYLMAFEFWLGASLGALAILMMQYLTGGEWALAVRRPAGAAALTLPLMAVVFLPILLGLKYLFPWADPAKVAESLVLQHKQDFTNTGFFILRYLIYFAIWLTMLYFLTSWSRAWERSGDVIYRRRIRMLSGPGIVIYGFTMTMAGVDWIMSREEQWYSTVLGFLTVVSQSLTAMTILVVTVILLRRRKPLIDFLKPGHFNDLGNLLLTMIILWAYMSFAQLLVQWTGNEQGDIRWYTERSHWHSWWVVDGLLIVFHFFVPFLLLLSRYNKRNTNILIKIAMLIFVMRLIDVFFWVAPSTLDQNPYPTFAQTFSWMYIVAPIAIGGLWLAVYLTVLPTRPLLPLGPEPSSAAMGELPENYENGRARPQQG